jgi:hypothetical protein
MNCAGDGVTLGRVERLVRDFDGVKEWQWFE